MKFSRITGTGSYLPPNRLSNDALAAQLAEQGVETRVGEISDLTFRAGKPYLHGTAIDVILRYYGLEEMLAHPDGEALMEPVFRAHEDGTVVVWTPTNVFGNKGTLAMLSEFAEDASVFDAGGLLEDLQELLSPYRVDLVSAGGLLPRDGHIRAEARPI